VKKKIAVLDAGNDGSRMSHHTATLETLLKFCECKKKYEINCKYFVSKNCCTALSVPENNNYKFMIVPWFSGDFYLARHNCEFKPLLNMVVTLSVEYRSIIKQMFEFDGFNPDIIVVPSLEWMHIYAFCLAVSDLKIANCQIIVCAEGEPNESFFFGSQNNIKIYWKSINALMLKSNVIVKFSSWSHAEKAVKETSGNKNIFSLLHPLMFVGFHDELMGKFFPSYREIDFKGAKIGMYIGDQKKEKGFYSVKDRLIEISMFGGQKSKLIVQVPHESKSHAIDCEVKEIEKIAAKYENIYLVKNNLTNSELLDLMRGLDMLYVEYAQVAYGNRTSGIIWLAALLNVPVIFSEDGELVREFERVGGYCAVLKDGESIKDIMSNNKYRFKKTAGNKLYRSWLVKDFWRHCLG
jgi:hypothetical protein